MTAGAPPDVIQAPVLAAAPPLSLVAAARTPALAGVRWEVGGVAYAPESGSDHGVLDPCSNAGFGSAQPSNLPSVTALPFGIWAADECSTFGFSSRDWEGRALRQLEAATPWEVEREFWLGNLAGAVGTEEAGNRFLADASHVVDISPAGAAVSVVDGVACLEQALGSTGYGAQGMIHMTRKAITALSADAGLLHRAGNVLMTEVDTVVVAGAGYPGTAPALPPPVNVVATPVGTGGTLATATYQYVVTAIDAAGETTASAAVTAAVTGPTGRVNLTWTAVTGATGYRVFRLVGSAYQLFGTPAGASFSDTGAAAINANTPPAANTTGALAEGVHYMYATDYVTVLLGQPVTRMAGESGLATQYGILDPGVNTLRYRAERLAAVAFDGYRHFGIKVNVASCGGSI